jgi:membrane-associated phospholipid phosphatase
MDNTADLPGKHTLEGSTLAGGVKRGRAQTRRNVAITLWLMGFMALGVACVIVRFHPAPWPLDLQTTITLQHLPLWPWLIPPIGWPSIAGDVLPSFIYPPVWFVVLSLIAVAVWRRGGSPIPWVVTALFLFLGTLLLGGLDQLIVLSVARPRPSSPLIQVSMPEPIPSFPSGHVEYAVVYYGFLLYLSLSKPVSQWRSRWLLIPFQLCAVLIILSIGFSRVYEGSHWLTDALGGYLSGALFLALLIVLYCWTLQRMTRWYEKRLMEKSARNLQA